MSNLIYSRKNIVFGAGGMFTNHYYPEMMNKNIEISYLCDNDPKKRGMYIKGIEVISFLDLLQLTKREDFNIIIASDYQKEIYQQLKEVGLEAFAYIDLLWDMCYLEEYKMLKNLKKYDLVASKIKNTLKDEISKKIYMNSFNYLISMDRNLIMNEKPREEQYFLEEFLPYLNGKVIVDCGAYIGDTLEVLFGKEIKPKKVIAFEAAKNNYKELCSNMRKITGIEFNLYNKGVWIEDINLRLSGDIGSGVKINTVGDEVIECICMDKHINEKIDFLKMDIEGAELNALKGAKELIKKSRPILAICIYHSIEEMVTIPEYLIEELKNYDFRVRRYSERGAEVVLYCIPKEYKFK